MILTRANLGTLVASLAIQGCGAVTGIATARILGPLARGELATVMLWPIIFSNLGLLGCNWALAREVAAQPEREMEWACAGVVVGFAAAIVFLVLGYLLVPYALPSDKGYLISLTRLCLLLIPLDILNQMLLAIDHGRMRWKRYNFLRASFFIFYVILICFIWIKGRAPVGWFVAVFLVSSALTVAFRFVAQRKLLAWGALHISNCRRLLRRGTLYWGATASNLLSLQIDKILVISLMSTEAAGIYTVALTFGNAQSLLGEALGITSFAILSTEKNTNRQGQILTETFRQSALTSAGLGLVLLCMVPLVIRPLFGIAFFPAVGPAVVLTIAAAVSTSGEILNEGLRGAGRPLPGIAAQLLGTGVLVLTAVLLLPRFGLMGMAWAVVASSCLQLTVLVASTVLWLGISPVCFWPFGIKDIRAVCQNLVDLRLKYSRSPA
jgi:O-antigen/teichoic acid export membrane protein